MSKKKNNQKRTKLLTESQIRRFKGLAGVAPLRSIHPLFEGEQYLSEEDDKMCESDETLEEGEEEELYEGDGVQHNPTGPQGAESKLHNGIKIKKGKDPYAPGQSAKDSGKGHVLKEMEQEFQEADTLEDPEGGEEDLILGGDNLPEETPDSAGPELEDTQAVDVLRAVADALGVHADISVEDGDDEMGDSFDVEGGFGGPPEDDMGFGDEEDEMLAEGIADLIKRVAKSRTRRSREETLEDRKRQWRERAHRTARRTKNRGR